MRFPKITSGIGAKLLLGLAVLYAIVAGVEIQRQTQSATYNREIFPEKVTEPLEGTKGVDYAFSAEHKTLKGLWVFLQVPDGAPTRGRLTLTIRRADSAAPFWSQSFACDKSQFVFTAFLCRVDGLTLKKGERYVMTYAMPDMKPGEGWRLFYSKVDRETSTLTLGSQVFPSTEPSMLWMDRLPRYSWRNLLAGVFLLILCSIFARDHTFFRIPVLIVLVASCILAATYYWQVHLWEFWGNFWPDGYPGLSRRLHDFFVGRISYSECSAYFQKDRCGQAFLVPLFMAMFQTLGLSVKSSYLATNAVSLLAAGGLLLALLDLHGIKSDRSIIATTLLFFSHRNIIGATAELQTDLAGIAATMFFVYALHRALVSGEPRTRLRWYVVCGVAAFLASTVRVALLSLPLIPACLFLWSLWCERQRPWRERAEYLIPTAVGIAVLVVSWSALGLWGTFTSNWAFSQESRALFLWKGFFITTVQCMQLSLLVGIVFWRRLFDDRIFAATVGTAFSLLALLAFARQPIWPRYWDAAAAVGVVLLLWPLKARPTRSLAFLILAWMSLALNFYLS